MTLEQSENNQLRVSRYVFLFERDEECFLYNARTNSFYSLSVDAYNALRKKDPNPHAISEELASTLRLKKVLTTQEEDDHFRDFLKLNCLKNNFGREYLSLTILPTVSCNLRCPYCFEQDKPSGMMSEEQADKIVDFIKTRASTGKYSITWFGGEPLLGLSAIEHILTKLEQEELTRIDHSIITNGTLLGKKASDLFSKFPLDSMQITLDGDSASHNRKRFFQSGEGTFDIILKNVSEFLKINPKCRVTFRVNVDNTNKEEYISVHNMLKERFKEYFVSVYPGILRANKGCEDETFFTSSQHLEFNTELWKNNIKSMYPCHLSKGCCATSISSYVIGPEGELYLCWEHAGNSKKIIGNIDGMPGPGTRRYPDYMLRGTCFSDPRCLECGLLPICSGGCPDKRIANLRDGDNYDLCSVYSDDKGRGLEEALYTYYKLTSKQQ